MEIWLQIFLHTSVIYFASLYICFVEEFKLIYKELEKLNKSCQVEEYFIKWRKSYCEVAQLVADLNDNFQTYLCYIIVIYTYGIMGALYNVTVSCGGISSLVIWMLRYLFPVFTVMCSAVAVSVQVRLIYHKNCP